ncbi:MAG: extracellular solute-binding protein [Jiangellales bacterium]
MSKPRSESDYLARMIPPSVAGASVPRRSFLRGAGMVGAGLAVPGLLAACGTDDSTSGSTSTSDAGAAAGGQEITFGLNEGDGSGPAYDRRVVAVDAYQAESGNTVKTNAVDHNTFQEQFNNYVQSNPDDVFTWFAGYRMQQFAADGLFRDISDIFPTDQMSEGFKAASTGEDGKQYFIPEQNYPWAVYYRKSLWDENGWTPPETLDELKALAAEMESAGIIPMSFSDKDGWPAMGTFDILNMRINGYDFHMSLMRHNEAWDSDPVKAVFAEWAELLPIMQPDPLGRTWQEAATAFQKNETGMYYFGQFAITDTPAIAEEIDDFALFPFPEIDPAIGKGAIDAPIDGYAMAANPKNLEGASNFLAWLGSPANGDAQSAGGYPQLWANADADTSELGEVQQAGAELIASAESIAQFLDRDTDSGFAATVVIPSLQNFLQTPGDADSILADMEAQAQTIFG